MIAEYVSAAFFLFAALWFFGGLALFAWVYDQRIVKSFKRTLEITKIVCKEIGLVAAMLTPFVIPIAVTALSLVFG